MWSSMRAAGSIATAAARGRRPAGHLLSVWSERVPACAERRQALAVGVAGLLVALVEVERVALIGDLWLVVGPGGGSDQRRIRPAADCRLAVRPERGPGLRAGAEAGALRPRVLPEQVERPPLSVDEDLAQAAVRDADRRRPAVRRLR